MGRFVWVGPRKSDIADCQELFDGSITFFGDGRDGNRSLSNEIGLRINHNDDSDDKFGDYCNRALAEMLASNPHLKVMYYNPSAAHDANRMHPGKVACLNDLGLLSILNDKENARKIAAREIPVVPYQATKGRLADLPSSLTEGRDAIVQIRNSSGGFGTYHVPAHSFGDFAERHPDFISCLVSPYFEGAVPINIHFVVSEKRILTFPGSVQVVCEIEGRQVYLGADFIEYRRLPKRSIAKAAGFGLRFAELCADRGYRGVLGVDFLLIGQEPLFLECNPRFQASSPLVNRRLRAEGRRTLQELNLDAFDNSAPEWNELDDLAELKVGYSMVSHVEGTWPHDDEGIAQLAQCPDVIDLRLDGLAPGQAVEPLAYLCSSTFETNVISVMADGKPRMSENLLRRDDSFSAKVQQGDKLAAKVSLINQGVMMGADVLARFESGSGIRQGVFRSVDVRLADGLTVNCPTGTRFAALSPWRVGIDRRGLCISYRGKQTGSVIIEGADPLASRLTRSGVPYSAYAFLAADRLRVHHARSCCFQSIGKGCRFCDVPPCAEPFRLDDVREVIDAYLDESSFRHFLIGGGSGEMDREHEAILQIAAYIRSRCDKPIYLMCLPPRNPGILDEYKQAGVDEVAFNLEVYDRSIARKVMPAKGAIPKEQYIRALERAVQLWGSSGNVRSLLIVGLEPEESLLEGVRRLCNLGVAPILSAFRPLPGTPMENCVPPPSAWLEAVTRQAESICREYDLSLGPACVECQNNVLTVPRSPADPLLKSRR